MAGDRRGTWQLAVLNGWIRWIRLAIQARSGATRTLFGCAASAAIAALIAFAFLCIAGYDWFAVQFGSVFAGLVMTAIFTVVTVIAIITGRLARQRARQRAILERASAHSALLDPKLVTLAIQLGRSIGWARFAPLALLGVLTGQRLLDYLERRPETK